MKTTRGLLLIVAALCAASLAGVAAVLARDNTPIPAPVALSAPSQPAVPQVVQGQKPGCENQDQDDDAAELKEHKKHKPDTDDVELECGDDDGRPEHRTAEPSKPKVRR